MLADQAHQRHQPDLGVDVQSRAADSQADEDQHGCSTQPLMYSDEFGRQSSSRRVLPPPSSRCSEWGNAGSVHNDPESRVMQSLALEHPAEKVAKKRQR